MLSMILNCLATRIIDEAMLLAEHADLHVASQLLDLKRSQPGW